MLTLSRATRGAHVTMLTLHAWAALVAFDLVAFVGFHRVHEHIRRCRVLEARAGSAISVDDVIWAVDEACVWYFKRAACLQRSAIATRLLRRHGINASLVIGYRPVPFESHAWVEVAGLIVNDRQQYQKFFAVLERL